MPHSAQFAGRGFSKVRLQESPLERLQGVRYSDPLGKRSTTPSRAFYEKDGWVDKKQRNTKSLESPYGFTKRVTPTRSHG
jgi:hypothetical protein